MPGKNPSAKTSFRLTPKHLLLAAFIVVTIAITALVVGVFQTLNRPQEAAAPRPAGENAVEIWSPRGGNSQTAPGTVVNVPNIPGTTPPPVEMAPEAAESRTAAIPRRQAPANTTPADNGERPLQPINQPAPAPAPATAAERPAPVPQATPTPRPPQPAPQPAAPRQQPKDVMDNLF